MKNPCRECIHIQDDKNMEVCVKCERRVAYAAGYGRPMDMQPLVNGAGGGGSAPAVGWGYDAGDDEVRTKVCRGLLCREIDPDGVEKPISEFGKRAGSRDGYNYICLACDCRRVMNIKASQKTVGADLRAARKDGEMENQAEYKTTKICRGPVCRTLSLDGVPRPVAEFGPGKGKDGRLSQCRMCVSYGAMKSCVAKKGLPAPDPAEYAQNYISRKNLRTGVKSPMPPFAKGGEKQAERPAAPIDTFAEGTLEHTAPPSLNVNIMISLDPVAVGRLKELLEPILRRI